MRNQIRIAQSAPCADGNGAFGATEWMEASSSNRWFLRIRLAEALEAHGTASHRLEMRPVAADPAWAKGITNSSDEAIRKAAHDGPGRASEARLHPIWGGNWSQV